MVSEKGNEKFVLRKHCEQSDGQSDIYNSDYDLDFKILIDPKYMEGQNLLSRSITEIAPGVTAYGNSKVNGKQQACFINWCFRDKSLADLIKIQQNGSSSPEEKVEKDTYISFISNQLFVISKAQEKELRLYDMVNTNQSEVYKYLMNVGKEF